MLLESCCGPKQIHAELAATNQQLKIWRDDVRPEASKKKKKCSEQDHMIICTFNYAQSSRGFSICVHQAQKKNNIGLPAGWHPG